MHQGAHGFLVKHHGASVVVDAVRRVARGQRYVRPGMADIMMGYLADDKISLQPRDVALLHLLADGLSNQEIADRLHLCRRAVQYRVEHLVAVLGHDRRGSVIAWAAMHGFGSHSSME